MQRHRRFYDDKSAASRDDVADLRFFRRRGHIDKRAQAGNDLARGQRQHRGDPRRRQFRQLRIVDPDGVGRSRLWLENLFALPALEFRSCFDVLRLLRRRLFGGPGVAEIDQTRVDRQALAVDHLGVHWRGDGRSDRFDDAAAKDDSSGFDRRPGGGHDARAADRVDVRRVGADTKGQ